MEIDRKPRSNGWHAAGTQSMSQNGHIGLSVSSGPNGHGNGVNLDGRFSNECLQNGNSWMNAVASTSRHTLDSMEHDVKPEAKPVLLPAGKTEDSDSDCMAPPADVDRFLAFELEEDKKYNNKKMNTNRGKSRSNSPHTPDLHDGSDVDDSMQSAGKAKSTLRKPGAPMSIAHLPVAEREALNTYEDLKQSSYQNKQIGLSGQQEESMQCECIYRAGDPESACGSNCINRMTQTECLASECRCKGHCLNQRFQRCEYAPIDIVQTEKKGFGVRAREPLAKDAFVYEYLGDIIGEKNFKQRMERYFDEGIRHFYFMALQKDEFIDATKRGGRGRFLNHSCAPNCYVAKWVVGKHMRMGIFTKRAIQKDEELTFNYNVDRYGHEAQECYCAEPNCVGFIGGKTQTDVDGMDDLLLAALGITDEEDQLKLKGSKKRKSKKLDEDFNPVLTPIIEKDVQKVALACRQYGSNRSILTKLLARIQMTEEAAVQRQLMRLHGFNLMSTLLHDYSSDTEIKAAVLHILKQWPLITRNKLVATNIETIVIDISNEQDQMVAESAASLLEMWQALEMGYRIPKAVRDALESGDTERRNNAEVELSALFVSRRQEEEARMEPSHLPLFFKPIANVQALHAIVAAKTVQPAPPYWQLVAPEFTGLGEKHKYKSDLTGAIYMNCPTESEQAHEAERYHKLKQAAALDVNDVIARARAQAEAKAAEAAAAVAAVAAAEEAAKALRKEKRVQKESVSKEKKMYRLFSTIVIRTMSKYKQYFETEAFKRRAKEVCATLCDKEKKRPHYATELYDSLDKKSESKIKEYVKDWIGKLLARKGVKVSASSHSKDKERDHKHSLNRSKITNSTDNTSQATPDTPTVRNGRANGEDMDMDDHDADDDDLIDMLVEDATATPDGPGTPRTGSQITVPLV